MSLPAPSREDATQERPEADHEADVHSNAKEKNVVLASPDRAV